MRRSTGTGRGRNGTGPTENFAKRKQELIDIAIEVFSTSGYSAGTTTEIADRAGLTQPALYHYVGGKQTFLEEICTRVGERLRSGLDEVLALDVTPAERLVAFVDTYTKIVFAEHQAFRIYVIEAGHLPKTAVNRVRGEEREFHDDVTRIVRDAAPDSTEDPWLTAQVIIGAISWGFRWYREQVEPEQFAASLMAMLRDRFAV